MQLYNHFPERQQMADGRWQTADTGEQVADGRWQIADSR
jgi:hypothetical protein